MQKMLLSPVAPYLTAQCFVTAITDAPRQHGPTCRMPGSSEYRSEADLDRQARLRCAVSQISAFADLIGIRPQQLMSLMDAGMRTEQLAELVAAKLSTAIKSTAP
jgi:hypothetical protein